MVESILHSGAFGILVVLVILALLALAVGSVVMRKLDVSKTIFPLPAILGWAFYSFCIWRTVPEILHSPGVRDPNWYFSVTSDAAFISFVGCVCSVLIFILNVLGRYVQK